MEAIAERGRAAMQWLLLLGLAAAWAMFDRSPRVLEEARLIVDGTLRSPEALGLPSDPLVGLPADENMLFRQYRHEHLRIAHTLDQGQQAARRQSLQPVTIGSTIALGKHVLAQIDAQPLPGLRESLVIAPLRQSLSRLETWQAQSGLGGSATLAQVEEELRWRVPIPGTEQAVPIEQCMLFVAVGLIGLQLFLSSLLSTLREMGRAMTVDRSWVILHRDWLGWLLTVGWLTSPTVCWFGQEIIRAVNEARLPAMGSAALAMLLSIATLATLRQVCLVRRALLTRNPGAVPGKIVPTRVKAA